jgi:hypothetical protein
MKSTLICVHVMPSEVEMFQRWIKQYKHSLQYLDENDNVTLHAVLNLNPLLTDWDNSELSKNYFFDYFNDTLKIIKGAKVIQYTNFGTDLMGTTQLKRECIKLNFDQFIFCDADIAVPEQLLKYQLLAASYNNTPKNYIIIPNTIRLWDSSWDCLTHRDYLNKDFGYYKTHDPELTYNQSVKDVSLKLVAGPLKFGCGMHTLYSKSFWDLVDIPEIFGGYGPEDTFGMFAGNMYNQTVPKHPIIEYVLDGIYITEDYVNRKPSFEGKIKPIDRKAELRAIAEANFEKELRKFKENLKELQ